MQEFAASITGVFRTILILLTLFFVVRILGRVLRPILDGKPRNKRPDSHASDSRRDGEVRIEYPKQKDQNAGQRGKKDRDNGEYIDFEEVD